MYILKKKIKFKIQICFVEGNLSGENQQLFLFKKLDIKMSKIEEKNNNKFLS